MSNRGNTKKRRVGGGDTGVSDNGGGSELAAIKSMMQELVQQNRTQIDMISNMQGKINNMQGEITRLSQKCNTTETTIKSVKVSQGKSLAAINSRFDEVNDKLKYHDILLQNQGWKYSAPHPSTEYWSNFDEDEENEAEDFLNHIKKSTEDMRYGTGDGEIEINANVSYNEELLPHWEEFAEALEQYHYHLKQTPDIVSTLELLNVELPETVIDLLSNAFESTHFQKIDMRHNGFGQKGINFTLKYLRSNRNLEELYLVGNPINNIADVKKLCKILRQHPSIENLALDNCKGGDINGYVMLTRIMTAGKNKLKLIRLSNNSISTEGGTFISDFLTTNPILENLSLEGNQLDDQDAIGISNAMKQNNHLCFLKLTDNNITKVGWMALREAEFDNTSLNAAADSNHMCNMKYPPDGSELIEGLDIIEMNGDRNHTLAFNAEVVRQKKIYSVLSSRNRDNSNVGHFEDIQVKLLPNMVHSIQKYSNYYQDDDISQAMGHVQPLSIVYEICRNWDESLAVFEALSS